MDGTRPVSIFPKSWQERGVPVKAGPSKAMETTTQFTDGKTETPGEGSSLRVRSRVVTLCPGVLARSWKAWIPGAAGPLISCVALSVMCHPSLT